MPILSNFDPATREVVPAEIQAAWQEVQTRIANACARCGRSAQSVRLLGAAKTVEATRLAQFIAAGLNEVGENYVQEGVAKKAELPHAAVRWHFIGALQSNKAKIAVREFDLIHSVDRTSLAKAVNAVAGERGKVQDVLLQVNVGDEDSKAGCDPKELEKLAGYCATLKHLRVCGLMCLPPYNSDAEQTRPFFRQLRELRDQIWHEIGTREARQNFSSMGELSMGMSDDFEVAIEEGATIIRLGTALFGRRLK